MFVREKKNRSGSISVQVIDKSQGSYRVIKSFGSTSDPNKLSILTSQAKHYISKVKSEGMLSLFDPPIDEDSILESYLNTISNAQLQVIGPELIFGILYDRIGYNAIKSVMFRNLVMARLFNPGSKLKTIDYLYRYQGVNYSISKIYRFLDFLCAREKDDEEQEEVKVKDIRDYVEEISFTHTKYVLGGDISVVFYDMTTLYFEASDEDDLRRTGFSKDGKSHCPQIFLGLLVGFGGNPIGYDIYEGNIDEGHTFIPFIKKIQKKYNIDKPVIVADSGLLSKNNINSFIEDGYEFIIGARPKSESKEMKQQIINSNLKFDEIKTFDKGDGLRLIISKTENRAKKDAYNRKKGLARLEKQIRSGKLTKTNINNRGYNKYLKMDGEVKVSIDLDKYILDSGWDGIKGFVTNTKLNEKDVIDSYRNLWLIERAFRMNKTDLEIRPIYHRLKNRIEGHICICFTAYTIMLELERILKKNKSNITLLRAQELTHNMYQMVYQLPNSKKIKTQILKMEPEQQELYDIVINDDGRY